MHESERERIFADWLASHKGILFKVVHAYAFAHADRQDQLTRRIVQLDDQATGARQTSELVLVVVGAICPIVIVLLGLRINQQPYGDNLFLLVSMILMSVGSVAAGIWELRRQVHKDVLPRKHRLEALLKELDAE